jgi:TRAP transporter TAXI family solute receptor
MDGGSRPARRVGVRHAAYSFFCAATVMSLGASLGTDEARAQSAGQQASPALTTQIPAQASIQVAPRRRFARASRAVRASARRAALRKQKKQDGQEKLARPATDERSSDGAVPGERVPNTITIVAGNLDTTALAAAADLAAVLDDGETLHVLPALGRGGAWNIRDVRSLKSVDLAIVQSNLLDRFRKSGEIGPLDEKLVYVAKLFNEEMHVIVRADSGLTSIQQLAGKTVNVGEVDGSTALIAHDIFARLGIAVREVNLSQADAIEMLKAGRIAASMLVAGKPAPAIAALPEGMRLLAVPFARPLQDDYLPASLSSEDYPDVVGPGQRIETLAVGSALVAYRWPKDSDRYRRIEKFVAAMFSRLADLQAPPHHPKWREVNLAATMPGWARFAGAEDWLKTQSGMDEADRDPFELFLSTRNARPASSEEREKLFREFLRASDARAH